MTYLNARGKDLLEKLRNFISKQDLLNFVVDQELSEEGEAKMRKIILSDVLGQNKKKTVYNRNIIETLQKSIVQWVIKCLVILFVILTRYYWEFQFELRRSRNHNYTYDHIWNSERAIQLRNEFVDLGLEFRELPGLIFLFQVLACSNTAH